jgi:hypothetical protein
MARKLTTRSALIALAAVASLAYGAASEIRSARGLRAGAAAAGIAMRSLQLSSSVVKAGERISATVALTGPAQAPSGAVTIYIGVDPEILSGPREVRIPNGQASATFMLYSKPSVRGARTGAISASTSSPQPYRLLTTSVSIVPVVVAGVAPDAAKPAPPEPPYGLFGA